MSRQRLRDAPRLDFDMIPSSHRADGHDDGPLVEHDCALEPTEPTGFPLPGAR